MKKPETMFGLFSTISLTCHLFQGTVNGGQPSLSSHFPFPPSQPVAIIDFYSKPKYKDKGFLQQKYCSEGLSLAQISSQIVSSKEAIRANLKRHKIEIRERGQHHGHPAQLKFGQKRVQGSIEEHQREHRVIETIKHLRNQGMSLRAIAKTLNQLKVPTKNRGKRWHPEIVKRVIGSM